MSYPGYPITTNLSENPTHQPLLAGQTAKTWIALGYSLHLHEEKLIDTFALSVEQEIRPASVQGIPSFLVQVLINRLLSPVAQMYLMVGAIRIVAHAWILEPSDFHDLLPLNIFLTA